ncbi:MAG: BMP family ABC transporter substrate-binding protein [Clostridiales bacterium]|nr:BMP family ABC transporter substrate-binding protein [Clostridiales bacterium]
MKRYIAIVMALFTILSVAGCNKVSDLITSDTDSEESSYRAEDDDDDALKAGFIFNLGTDATDTIARIADIRTMQSDLDMTDSQILIETDVSNADCGETIDSLVEDGCNIIFACYSGYEDAVLEAAASYPDVEFCVEGGKQAEKSELTNVHNYYVRLYEGYYAAGVAAGVKLNQMLNDGEVSSDNCVIGFVANKENARTISCINAFYLGVNEVCTQSTVMVRYTDSRGVYDDDGEAAQQLVKAGAGLMCQFTSTTAAAAVCAENDIPIVGNEVNIINTAPNEAITSVAADWSVYYTYAMQCVEQEQTIDTDWCGGYEEGAVTLTQLNDQYLEEGTVEKLQAVELELRNGTAAVFDTTKFTVNDSSLADLVETDDDFSKYKKYLSGDEYLESSKRSAPTMDFYIDGVEVSTYDYIAAEEATSESTDEYDSDDEYDETDDSDTY